MASSRRVEALEKESRERGSEVDDLTQKLAHLKMQYTSIITETNSSKENFKAEIQFLKVKLPNTLVLFLRERLCGFYIENVFS